MITLTMVSLVLWTATGRLSVLPAFDLQLLQPVEHQVLILSLCRWHKGQVKWGLAEGPPGTQVGASYLEGEGALGSMDVEAAAAVVVQQGAEGGAAKPDLAQRGQVLWPAVVQQLVPLHLVAEPALLPGLQRTTELQQETTQLGLI